ncbi:interleukin-1 receptor accessory protein-like [Heptranchias perlo]|uniref:interleukin-1 receptor accessory protein-like n=1 Tax=Heptranchias perlo TaxID=212740 RepID=UPI003559E9D0
MPWAVSVFVLWILACIGATETLGHSESGQCLDWGVDSINKVKAYDGEPARIRCPLFLTYIKSSYSMAHGMGLTLVWYKTRRNEELEEPIDFHQAENRVAKEKDVLWFWPVFANDSGNYTCMLRNTTYCIKVAVPLLVIQKPADECTSNEEMVFPSELAIGESKNLSCPDTADFSKSSETSTIAWYKGCHRVTNNKNMVKEIELGKLSFLMVREYHGGEYTCIATVMRRSRSYNLTRTVIVSIAANQNQLKPPVLVQPNADQQMEVEYDKEVNLTCKVFFHYIRDSPTTVWWSIDGKNAQELAPTVKIFRSEELLKLKDKTITKTISIKAMSQSDLQRNYTCFAQNSKGLRSVRVTLIRKAPSYVIELGCALGVTLLILVTSIVVYHFWWIEIILLYRLYFGTDETIGDGKEYDVYVSYARNAEEEEFVLTTLRSVLENEYGYKVCIYDRDSLPGGNVAEGVFSFVERSRRMIIVLSPDYLAERSVSLLELKAGSACQRHGSAKIIIVEYKPARRLNRELLRLRHTASYLKWKGDRSRKTNSRFWKVLRLALPSRTLTGSRLDSCSTLSEAAAERPAAGAEPAAQAKAKAKARPRPTQRTSPDTQCRLCVRYCNNDKVAQCFRPVAGQPGWETQVCKPALKRGRADRTATRARPGPSAPPNSLALNYRYYIADVSNNNDLYVL